MIVRTLLLAEDDGLVRRVLSRMLQSAGYRVLEVTNGKDAVRTASSEPVDLVISDVIMPEMDGIELLKDVLALDVPVILMSGGGRIDAELYLRMASMLGAAAVLQKPVDPATLLQTVASALDDQPA